MKILLALAACAALASVSLSTAASSSSDSPGAAPETREVTAAVSALGKAPFSVGVDVQNASLDIEGVSGTTTPTVVNSIVVKVGKGPVVAHWSGELFGTDSSSDIILAFDASLCMDPLGIPCTILGPAIMASPVPGGGGIFDNFNYSLRTNVTGFDQGTSAATAAWLPGALVANKYYKFTVKVGDFDGISTTRTRVRILTIEPHK